MFTFLLCVWSTYAQVPRDNLELEYLFQNEGITDTSDNNYSSELKGVWSFWRNTEYWKDFLNFEWQAWGYIDTSMWWSADKYGRYSISFWYKWKNYASNGYYSQVLVSSDNGNILSYYRDRSQNEYCSFFSEKFDCSVTDDKWNHVVIRKDRNKNEVYINGKRLFSKQAYSYPLGRKVRVWGSHSGPTRTISYYTLTDGNKRSITTWYRYPANGSFHNFRIYSDVISNQEIANLYLESSGLRDVQIASYVDPDIVDPVAITDISQKDNYTITFDVTTPLSGRDNPNNVSTAYRYEYVYADTFQMLFSWNVGNQSDKLTLILDKNYQCELPYGSFNCEVLKDEQKHTFLIQKNGDQNTIYIDGNLVFEQASALGQLWDDYILKKSWANISQYYKYCPGYRQAWKKICYDNHNFVWEIENVTFYPSLLKQAQRNRIFILAGWGEVSDTSLKTTILSTTSSGVIVEIKNITGLHTKEVSNYEYSFDGENYTTFLDEDIQVVWDWNTSYILNFENISEDLGDTFTLYLRNISDSKTYNFAQLAISRDIENSNITINNPNTSSASSKTITASFEGELSMAITNSDFCHAGLSFETYTPLTFTSTSDNGTFVCYKWVLNSGKQFYSSSSEILGITVEAEVSSSDSKVFEDYKTWRYSKEIKPNDGTYMMLSLVGQGITYDYKGRKSRSAGSAQMIDVNGDGLVDMLYNLDGKQAILINNGDYTFQVVYKCVSDNGYYGSCAK